MCNKESNKDKARREYIEEHFDKANITEEHANAYVVAPPSNHISGRNYEWESESEL